MKRKWTHLASRLHLPLELFLLSLGNKLLVITASTILSPFFPVRRELSLEVHLFLQSCEDELILLVE